MKIQATPKNEMQETLKDEKRFQRDFFFYAFILKGEKKPAPPFTTKKGSLLTQPDDRQETPQKTGSVNREKENNALTTSPHPLPHVTH
jgi:hypothetical protein